MLPVCYRIASFERDSRGPNDFLLVIHDPPAALSLSLLLVALVLRPVLCWRLLNYSTTLHSSIMPFSIPPELKKITPFVRRAEELDRDKENPESRLVAYYCRQYAVHMGIPLAKSPEAKHCLGTILGELEEEKSAMSNFTRDESKYVCRKFADKVFDKADGEDRMGLASKGTARTFYAAASFFEILQQFYEEDEISAEREEERKRTVYAKWKAMEIVKAFQEGRKPTPGGYGEVLDDEDEEEEETPAETPREPPIGQSSDVSAITMPPLPPPVVETVEDEHVEEPKVVPQQQEEEYNDDEGTEVGLLGLEPPPAFPEESLPDEVFVADSNPPTDRPPIVPPPVYKPPPPASKPQKKSTSLFGMGKKKTSSESSSSGKVSKAALADAVELTNFALAALKDKDVELGATRLQQALAALGK